MRRGLVVAVSPKMTEERVAGSAETRTPMEALLRPASVAVIGASADRTTLSGRIVNSIVRYGFPGQVYFINPKHERLAGLPCWPSLEALPHDTTIDVAIINLRADAVEAVVERCLAMGIRALVVLSAGFAEMGREGAQMQARIAKAAHEAGAVLVGPNSAGVASLGVPFFAYGAAGSDQLDELTKGDVAVVSQSGGIGYAIFSFCQEIRLGISTVVSTGNEASTVAVDYLEYLLRDGGVGVVLAFLDAVRQPERFFAVADEYLVRGVPIVAIKNGRSAASREAMLSHTAALGGSAKAFAGAFAQHGIVQVKDLDALIDLGLLFSRAPAITGRRVGIVSLPGGGASLTADLANDFGFAVPALDASTMSALREALPPLAHPGNPLDPGAGFARDPERLERVLTAMAADPNVDVVVFFPLVGEPEYARQLAERLAAVTPGLGKPVVCIWTAGRNLADGAYDTLHSAGVPLFHSTTRAFEAMRSAVWYAERRRAARARRGDDAAGLLEIDAERLGEAEHVGDAERLLELAGIPKVRRVVVRSAQEAAAAGASMSWPVAMKVVSPDIAHKSDVGGVLLNVADEAGAVVAYDEILRRVGSHRPDARILGVEVQEMVGGGVEALLGVFWDDDLGPQLSVGLGGVFAEDLNDVATRPVPISRADAESMLSGLRAYRMFEPTLARFDLDRPALVDCMLRLSKLAEGLRQSRPSIDINPLVVRSRGRGAVAVDWRIAQDTVGGTSEYPPKGSRE